MDRRALRGVISDDHSVERVFIHKGKWSMIDGLDCRYENLKIHQGRSGVPYLDPISDDEDPAVWLPINLVGGVNFPD